MKANELRIGNWLIGYDNKPFQWSEEDFYTTQGGLVSELVLSPIPLTEEILLKAGFEKEGFGFYLYKYFIVRKIRLTDNHWRFIFRHRDIKDIEHLHELQNLIFALTGEEIKIEL